MYLAVAAAAGVFALAVALFGPGRPLLWLPFSAIVFSPRQREVWLWSYLEFYPFVSAVFLGAVFALWRWPGSRRALAGAALLGAIATFSVASGLAVWPVLFLALPALGFHSRADRLLWLGAMLVVLVGYFVHYHWLRGGVVTGPLFLGGFLLAYLGSPLVLFDAGALAAARWIAVAGLALTAANGVYLWRAGRDADRRRLAAGVALIAFALACGVLTAAGRGGSHGMVQALASRYVTHGSLFWLGAVGLCGVALSVAREGGGVTRVRRVVAALNLAALLLVVARIAMVSQSVLAAPPLVTAAQEACVRAYPRHAGDRLSARPPSAPLAHRAADRSALGTPAGRFRRRALTALATVTSLVRLISRLIGRSACGSRSAPSASPGATLALALTMFAAPAAARAQSVHHDFEDGTAQGWVPRGSAVLTVTPEAAATGVNSLKVTGRTANWNGPSLDVMPTIQRDRVYQLRVSVRLTAGQLTTQDTLRMTIERRVVGETSDRFDQVAASANNGVTSAGWVTLQGSYALATDVSKLILYVESGGANTEFYIDDFHLDEVVPDQTGFACDFETDQGGGLYCYTAQGGGDRNWTPRGSAVLANVTEQAHGGTRSLRVTGRTAVWNGPALDILGKMTRGFRYRATVWVKLAAGEPDTNVRVSIERRLAGATNFTTVIPNTMVTANEWIRLSALFTMPADVDFLSFYVETATAATASFYIDDVSLTFAPPLPIQTDIPSLKDVLAEHFPIGARWRWARCPARATPT